MHAHGVHVPLIVRPSEEKDTHKYTQKTHVHADHVHVPLAMRPSEEARKKRKTNARARPRRPCSTGRKRHTHIYTRKYTRKTHVHADHVHVPLVVLAPPPARHALVAPALGEGEPFHREGQGLALREGGAEVE